MMSKPGSLRWQADPTRLAAISTMGSGERDIRSHYNRSAIPSPNTSSAFVAPFHPRESTGLFSASEYAQVRAFFGARPDLAPTPTRHLPALAEHLRLGALFAKDETARFGLNAFKLLGGLFAIETLIAEGAIRPGDTLVCASEGNHGRAVAHAARQAGCRSRVYMAGDAAAARVAAIAGEGADVVRIEGSYDDAVRIMRGEAAAQGWTIVSDTSWQGYERIPRLIMLGYTRMIDEISSEFDTVFVQGGVGGLLCGVASACAFPEFVGQPLHFEGEVMGDLGLRVDEVVPE